MKETLIRKKLRNMHRRIDYRLGQIEKFVFDAIKGQKKNAELREEIRDLKKALRESESDLSTAQNRAAVYSADYWALRRKISELLTY